MKSCKNNLTDNTKQNGSCGFTLIELLIVIMFAGLIISFAIPSFTDFNKQLRVAACVNHLKKIGAALDIFYQDHHKFPPWHAYYLTHDGHLNPWPDILLTNYPFNDPELLESNERWQQEEGYIPDQLLDKEQLFHCPKDNPHPSRVNEDRANAWGLYPYEYKYGISVAAVWKVFHEDKSQQILCADSNWTWMQDLSGYYLLGAPFDYPSWYSNTVAYRHKNNSANFLFRDYHVENHSAEFDATGRQIGPDREKIFFFPPGEPLNF